MNWRRWECGLITMWLLFSFARGVCAVPSVSAGATAGAPGAADPVPVSILVDTNVVAFQFDLLYATNYLTPGTPVGGDALADQQLASGVVAPGLFRVLGYTLSNSPLTNGVLAYVPFAIAANAPDHDEILTLSNVVLVSAELSEVPATVNSNAILSITVPPHFSAIFPTNAGAMHLELGGTAGRVYLIQTATNLVSPQWQPLTTKTNLTGVLDYDDLFAGGLTMRFYRAEFVR